MKSDAEAAEAFSKYLKFWTEKYAILNPREVQDRALRKGAQVSDSKVGNVLLAQYANHQMRALEAIAIGIGRPPEEVFLAALGYYPPLTEHPGYKESDLAHLWQLLGQLPVKRRKVYEHFIQMLANDIQRTTHESDNE